TFPFLHLVTCPAVGSQDVVQRESPQSFRTGAPRSQPPPGPDPTSAACHAAGLTPMAWTFRFLEEVALADIGFEAEGESVEEVFRGATQALLESMANPATVPGKWERTIEQRA